MTPNEYQSLAMRTASGISTSCPENLLLQGVMGMSGESGEALDIVKKIMFQGHELNEATKEHLIRELGDVLWYVATTAESPERTARDGHADQYRQAEGVLPEEVRCGTATAQRGGRHMNEWTCDECKYKDVPTTTFPCCDCLDGDEYEPEEGSENHADT